MTFGEFPNEQGTELDHFLKGISIPTIHYWRRRLCRVPEALGKGRYTLGKAFAECYTRQRALGKQFIGKDLFTECTLSDTRQRLCRVPIRHSAKKSSHDGERHRDGGFAECKGQAPGKGTRFAERH